MTENTAQETSLGQQPHAPPAARPTKVPGNERLNAFCDGVFAIVITLLVLEIKVPEIPIDHIATELPAALLELVPKIFGHILSFAVLGIYWVGHHNQMVHVKHHDRIYQWLTILFLLCVASMPFPTGLLIHYPDQQAAVIIYASTLIAGGLALDLLWWYATRNHHLVSPNMPPDFIRFVHRRILTAPLFYVVAIIASFFSVLAANLIFVATALYYILPNPFDRYHHHAVQQTGAGE